MTHLLWRAGLTHAARSAAVAAALLGAPLMACAQASATSAAAGPVAAAADKDAWYGVELMGNRAGYMHSRRVQEGDRIISSTRMVFELGRGERKVRISMESEFVETASGKPVSMKSRQQQGQTPVEQEYTFREDGKIDVVTRQAGQVTNDTVGPLEGEWMTPARAEEHAKQLFKAGEKSITLRTVDPMIGLTPVEVTRTGFTPATLEVDGKPVSAIETSVEQSVAPGVTSKEWLDSEGELLRGETALGGGGLKIIMTRTTRELASRGAGGAAPEIMVSTFVKPDKAIPRARASTAANYTLSVREGELPDFPDTGSQDFTRVDARTGTLAVRTSDFSPASADDIASERYMSSSALVGLDDPRLGSFVGRVDADLPPDKRAEELRRLVHEFIADKNLGTGLGSSTEVLRTKEGDCTEHGVLLCAALRKAGIPARVATGLIYADAFAGGRDIFGYHMWTQALLSVDGVPRWVDLDATLSDARPYDATHIAIETSDLSDETGTLSLLNVASVMGRLQITVQNVSHEEGH